MVDKALDAWLSLNLRQTVNVYWALCVFICFIWQTPSRIFPLQTQKGQWPLEP